MNFLDIFIGYKETYVYQVSDVYNFGNTIYFHCHIITM